jgi:ABC-type sugar transport system ATPase subunit
MSIATDIRSYADTAVEQGKQVIDQAQTQLTGVNKQANEFVAKFRGNVEGNVSQLTARANGTVADLRAQAEKAVNLDAIKTAVEPYLAQARGYSTTVTDRAEGLLGSVKDDKRVAFVVAKAEALTGTVIETVTERLVKPVQSITGRGGKSAAKPAKSSAKPTAKATPVAAAKPVAKPAAKVTQARTTARKTATARKTTSKA